MGQIRRYRTRRRMTHPDALRLRCAVYGLWRFWGSLPGPVARSEKQTEEDSSFLRALRNRFLIRNRCSVSRSCRKGRSMVIKMQFGKRILLLLCAVLMLFSMFPAIRSGASSGPSLVTTLTDNAVQRGSKKNFDGQPSRTMARGWSRHGTTAKKQATR